MSKVIYNFSKVPANNHGCRGYELAVEVDTANPQTGVVLSGSGCASCWQVGHDDSSSPIPVGQKVTVSRPTPKGWAQAAELFGQSHNELVDDYDDPQPDSSREWPRWA